MSSIKFQIVAIHSPIGLRILAIFTFTLLPLTKLLLLWGYEYRIFYVIVISLSLFALMAAVHVMKKFIVTGSIEIDSLKININNDLKKSTILKNEIIQILIVYRGYEGKHAVSLAQRGVSPLDGIGNYLILYDKYGEIQKFQLYIKKKYQMRGYLIALNELNYPVKIIKANTDKLGVSLNKIIKANIPPASASL